MSNQEQHLQNTIDPTLFQIEDVSNDNSCFYRSTANCFNYLTPSNNFKHIQNLYNYGKYKDLKNIYNIQEWGYNGDKQEKLARNLQNIIYTWIINNIDLYLEEYHMDVKTILTFTHEIDVDTYIDRYQHFAGDIITKQYDTGRTNKHGKPIIKKYKLEDRWGGTPEHIAISEMFEIPIVIIHSQKYDVKKDKIITGKIRNNKPEKNVRFKIIQIFGRKYLYKKDPIFLLWKKHNRSGHYMSLYIKNIEYLPQIYTLL